MFGNKNQREEQIALMGSSLASDVLIKEMLAALTRARLLEIEPLIERLQASQEVLANHEGSIGPDSDKISKVAIQKLADLIDMLQTSR